jgi:predicted membrane GTPase involved in stress response
MLKGGKPLEIMNTFTDTKLKQALAAELDGWTELENNKSNTGLIGYRYQHKYAKLTGKELIPHYATSYDAIIPLIQKQPNGIKLTLIQMINWAMTPSQILDALLVATGKATL